MKRKKILFLLLFVFYLTEGQVVTLVDEKTKEIFNFKEVIHFFDGSIMNDTKIDDVIYKKINGKYYKRIWGDEITPVMYGVKGDAYYKNYGDLQSLYSGTDDTQAISEFINSRKQNKINKNHLGGSFLYIPHSIYKVMGNYIIDDHYTIISGDGQGATIIHALNKNKDKDKPLFIFRKSIKGNSWDDLLTGGGLQRITLKTDNSSIRNIAVGLDFVEYMTFRDLYIEGFGKSAIKGTFWECYFDNLKLTGCGSQQTLDENGEPLFGIVDTSNDNPARSNLSNNTLFNKLTFSSCFGTLLRLTSNFAQSVNMNINGIYAETYFQDSGIVDELPLVFVKNSIGNTINGGFITINSTGNLRSASVIKMNGISELKLSSLSISFNPINGYLVRPIRRLKNIVELKSINSKLYLTDVTFSDQVDAVGYGLESVPPLIQGIGICNLNNVVFNILDYNSGGTRRFTNLVDRRLKSNGTLLVIPYDKNGEIPSLRKNIRLNNGKLILSSDILPNSIETWEIGDKIEYTNTREGRVGKVCISPGTTGTLKNIIGNIKKGTNILEVNSSKDFLVGDWIEIFGSKGYNRIEKITKNRLFLEQKHIVNSTNSSISFHSPLWKEIYCMD